MADASANALKIEQGFITATERIEAPEFAVPVLIRHYGASRSRPAMKMLRWITVLTDSIRQTLAIRIAETPIGGTIETAARRFPHGAGMIISTSRCTRTSV